MTSSTDQNQVQSEQKPSDKELNFRALEAKYQRQLEQERAARVEAERQYQEAATKKQAAQEEEDDSTSEPYVDHKRLDKKMASFEKRMEAKIEQKAEEKARTMMEKEKRDNWLKNNPDFYEVMNHADKLAERDPELADTILSMPEGFERQKLAYKTIKGMGFHKAAVQEPNIQDKIDANRRSPYDQPSGTGSAPYASQGDFSEGGQKNAYKQMKKLQERLGGAGR
jgi:hypothetical protein